MYWLLLLPGEDVTRIQKVWMKYNFLCFELLYSDGNIMLTRFWIETQLKTTFNPSF